MALSQEDKDKILTLFDKMHSADFKIREHAENENRNPYQRDYARILYSASFRRLQGKMQILGVDNTSFYRNRLTHSLEVSQIATGILLQLYNDLGKTEIPMDDYFVLEAAALAHDIGHPAFGHSGERILNKLGEHEGIRFEGNAHNFRILRQIEKKLPDQLGLNLTIRTLLAINKYIVSEEMKDSKGKAVKKFIFKDDFNYLNEKRERLGLQGQRTIDVQIIELADDIAYAAHDLEDGLSTRNFNIDELLYRLDRRLEDLKDNLENYKSKPNADAEVIKRKEKEIALFEEALGEFREVVLNAEKKANDSSSYKTNQEYSQVFRQSMTSGLINLLLSDLSYELPDEDKIEKRGTDQNTNELTLGKYSKLCEEISNEVFNCISREPHIAIYEARGKKLITDLFNLYSNPDLNKNGYLFPPDFRHDLTIKNDNGEKIPDKKAYAQAAIDYIAGMMDDYAKSQYKRYFNVDFDEIDISDDNDQAQLMKPVLSKVKQILDIINTKD